MSNRYSHTNFWDVFWTKKDRCIELYYESSEHNIIYCHGKIYKILGEISNEILETQQLLSDIGESSDYESFNSTTKRQKIKSRGVQIALVVFNLSMGVHFL